MLNNLLNGLNKIEVAYYFNNDDSLNIRYDEKFEVNFYYDENLKKELFDLEDSFVSEEFKALLNFFNKNGKIELKQEGYQVSLNKLKVYVFKDYND